MTVSQRSFTSPHEIQAHKYDPNTSVPQPRRLLLVPELATISDVTIYAGVPSATNFAWSFDLIKEVMEWSDLLCGEQLWTNRVVIVSPDFEMTQHYLLSKGPSPTDVNSYFYESWESWVRYVCGSDIVHWTNWLRSDDTKLSTHGVPGQGSINAGGRFFDKPFFEKYQTPLMAWASIFGAVTPTCQVDLEHASGNTLYSLFESGCVTRTPGDETAPEEVVILQRVRKRDGDTMQARAFAVPFC